MERAVLVYTTWPSIVEAEAAGRKIVEKRLAACVNILPGMMLTQAASRRSTMARPAFSASTIEGQVV